METNDETEGDWNASRGGQIGSAILTRLCRHVTFSELKRLRLVCRDWNIYVSQNRRMKNSRAVFGQNWTHEVSSFNFESAMQWKNIYFRYFPFTHNTIFPTYWKTIGPFVTTLSFKFVKMSCTQMAIFLNSLPLLEDLTFNNCLFEFTKTIIQLQHARPGRPTATLVSCCNHEGMNDDLRVTLPAPRIRRLCFSKENYFPLCLLDLLEQRCRGTLRDFTYQEARWNLNKRSRFYPTKAKVDRYLVTIVENNRATLEKFSWYKIRRGEEFLRQLIQRNVHLSLREVKICLQRTWDAMTSSPLLITFIDTLVDHNTLEVLDVGFIHRFDAVALSGALILKTRLKSLAIESIWSDNRRLLDLTTVFPSLPELENLVVRDMHRRSEPSIAAEYINHIPRTIKSLHCSSTITLVGLVEPFLVHPWSKNITSLTIEGNSITNPVMQVLIKTLTQLEELGIHEARYLTDAGVSGIPEKTCKSIILCNQRNLLLGDFELDPANKDVPVSQLTKLRKLSFSGCRKLSDISVIIAIRFAYLREIDLSQCLDVTDIGLLYLAKHNPGLERIVIMRNLKITHYGINEVLKSRETIANIHTSKKVRNRKLGQQLDYVECPRFKNAVTYNSYGERRARPMWAD